MGIDSKPKSPVTFTKPVAKRIARAVKRTEKSPYWHANDASSGGFGPWVTIQPAEVTTAIPTGTLASPSTTGRVTIHRDDDVGGLEAAETDQEVHNYHTLMASVPVGTTISVYWRAGFWWLIQPDCY